MPMTLAARLAAGQVTNREVAYLMLCNLVFGSIVFYGAFTWANPPWTLLSLVEFVTVVAITTLKSGARQWDARSIVDCRW